MKKLSLKITILQLVFAIHLTLLSIIISPQPLAFDAPWDQGHRVTNHDGGDGPNGPDDKPDCGNNKGSPVFVSSGDLIWTELDIKIRGRMPLILKRSYNSHDPREGIFGKGWTSNCEPMLIKVSSYSMASRIPTITPVDDDIAYILLESTGTRHYYTWSSDKSSINAPKWRLDKVEPQNDGRVKLIKLDGSFRIFSKQGQLEQIADRNGNSLTYTRDGFGRLSRVLDEHGRYLDYLYDSTGHVSNVLDHTGRSWQYAYNIDGALTSVTNPVGGKRLYEYQGFDLVDYSNVQVQSNTTIVTGISGAVQPTGTFYNYQQLTKVTDETGVIELGVTYNDRRVNTYTEGENTYTYTYPRTTASVTNTLSKRDSTGSVWRYTYDETDGQITEKTDPRDYKESWLYDEHSLISQYSDKLGNTWQYVNDSLGRRISNTDPLGRVTQWAYLGDKPWPVKKTSPSGQITTMAYDARGNIVKITDPAGAITQLEYNITGDLTALIDAEGNRSEIEYSNAGLPTLYKDALGRVTQVDFNNLGQMIQVTNPENEIYRMGYDALNRVTSQENNLNQITTFSYDASGRLLIVTDANNYDIGIYNYDSYGRIASALEAGINYNYTYNSNNTTASRTLGDITHTYTYDRRRLVTLFTTGDITIRRNYDAKGRLISTSGNGPSVIYRYDTAGQISRESQSFRSVDFVYNSDSRLISYAHEGVTYQLQRDVRGQIEKLTTRAGDYRLTHDLRGQLTQQVLPNGTQLNNSYDNAGQLSAQDFSQNGGVRYEYTYDNAGRLVQVVGDGSRRYSYDGASRLIRATQDGVTYNYQYDPVGNRIENEQMFAPANRLTENANNTYEYDVRGNLIKDTEKTTGGYMTYLYNGLNQLVEVKDYPDAITTIPDNTITYVYDSIGRRTKKTNGINITDYHWLGNKLITEYENTRVSVVYSYAEGNVPIEVQIGTDVLTVHSDKLGVPRYLTDQNNQIVWQNMPDPFGVSQVNEDPDTDGVNVTFNMRFPGQYHDQETGLYYNNFRYYDPSTGRYITSDPIGLSGGANTYTYVGGRPTIFIDSLGLTGNLTPFEYNRDRLTRKVTGNDGASGPFRPDLARSPRGLIYDAINTSTNLSNQFQNGNVTGALNTIYNFLGLNNLTNGLGGAIDMFGRYTEEGIGGFKPGSGSGSDQNGGGSDGDGGDGSGGETNDLPPYVPTPPCLK